MTAPVTPDSPRLRLTVLLIIVCVLFLSLVARLWFLQVVRVAAAKKQIATSASGQITIYTPAPRGRILDRDGRVLVANRNVPVIEVQSQDATDTPLVARLAALAGTTVKAMHAAIASNQYFSYEYVPVVQDATPMQILYVQEHAGQFPGVQATTETIPYVTKLGEAAGALLGYVGPIDSTQLASLRTKGYEAGDIIGQAGIEAQYESQLHGTPGKQVIQVNADGQYLYTLSTTPPVPGHDIRLSIDAKLQEVAVTALEQGEAAARQTHDTVTDRNFTAPGGSAVALDPNNGQVLALATNPSYDPNLFDDPGGISEAQYLQLNPCANAKADRQEACALAHPADPLLDRAIQGEYAPGSTFKLATATAGLKYGLITPTSPFSDPGEILIGTTPFHDDDDQGLGVIELPQAITESSDDYFYTVGADLWDGRSVYGEDALQNVADDYGFNKVTGIDLPDEASGVIPTPRLYAEQYREAPADFPGGPGWYTGTSAITAIGQGEVLVTPLQLANAYAAFANGGTLYRPQLALDAQTTSGRIVQRYQPTILGHSPALSADQREAMLAGFTGVVNNVHGTAYADFLNTPLAAKDIAGKTGTAQVTGAGKQNTSVFTSFAPASKPQYVIDAVIEDAGYGASDAAPVVREMYDQLYHEPLQPVTYLGASGNST